MSSAPSSVWLSSGKRPSAAVLVLDALALGAVVAAVATAGSGRLDRRPVVPPVYAPAPVVDVGYVYPTDPAGELAGRELAGGARFAQAYLDGLHVPEPPPGARLPLAPGSGLVGGARIDVVTMPLPDPCDTLGVFTTLVRKCHVVAIIGSQESTDTLQRTLAPTDPNGNVPSLALSG